MFIFEISNIVIATCKKQWLNRNYFIFIKLNTILLNADGL